MAFCFKKKLEKNAYIRGPDYYEQSRYRRLLRLGVMRRWTLSEFLGQLEQLMLPPRYAGGPEHINTITFSFYNNTPMKPHSIINL